MWASARFWECCKFDDGEIIIIERKRCYKRLGIVSYSVGESDMRWEWARLTGHIILLHAGRLATSYVYNLAHTAEHCREGAGNCYASSGQL